jgi:hypothetical protein
VKHEQHRNAQLHSEAADRACNQQLFMAHQNSNIVETGYCHAHVLNLMFHL